MASRIRGITIEFNGETKNLDKALKQTNDNLSKTQKELNDVNRLLKLDPKNVDLLRQKEVLLERQTGEVSNKLDTLRDAANKMDKAMKSSGETTEEQAANFRALQREIAATEAQQKRLNDEQARMSGDVGTPEAQTGSESLAFAGGGTALLVEGGRAALEYIGETEELRRSLSLLDQAAQENGSNIEKVREQWRELYGVVGDQDSTIEAMANLLQSGFNDTQMEAALDAISGAVIRFPDTLKVESLADSMQETLATGTATGQYAELLERLGIDAEKWNEQLAACTTEAEKQNFALETLTNAGLADTYNGWREANAEMVAGKENQIEIQESLAEIGESLQPVMTSVTGFLSDFAKWFADNKDWLIAAIAGIAAGLLAWNVVGMITNLINAFKTWKTATEGVTLAQKLLNTAMKDNPVGLVITAVTALIAVFAALWTNCEGFRDFFIGMWDGIVAAVTSAWDWIVSLFSKGGEIFDGVVGAIADVFKTIVNGIISGINWVIAQPFNTINGILNWIRNVDILGFKPFEGFWGENPLPVPQIPMLATGGAVSTGSVIVGEAGAELLTMVGGRAIVQPLTGGNAPHSAAGATANVNVTINNGQFTQRDAVQIARMVNRELGKVY